MSDKKDFRAEYGALRNAIHRCHCSNNKQYEDYGGRGITVCDAWRGQDGFALFLAHAGPKPAEHLTLDRINNDLGYEPGNVRWVDRKTQQNNRRARIGADGRRGQTLVTIGSVTQTIPEWSAQTGVPETTIRMRVRAGVSGLDVISTTRLPHWTFSLEERRRDVAGKTKRKRARMDK